MYILDLKLFTLLHSLAGHSIFGDLTIVSVAEYLPFIVGGLAVLYAFWCYQKREWTKLQGVMLMFASTLLARFLVSVIRYFYHHARPFVTLHFTPLIPENSYSFPSGHATFFFAMAMGMYLIDKKWGWVYFGAAVFISLARVVAGVHWPFDIISGAVLGSTVAYLVVTYCDFQKYFRSIEK